MDGAILQNPVVLSREGHTLSFEIRCQTAIRNVISMPGVLATSVGSCSEEALSNQQSLRAFKYSSAASSTIFQVRCEARSRISIAGSFWAPLAIARVTSERPLVRSSPPPGTQCGTPP